MPAVDSYGCELQGAADHAKSLAAACVNIKPATGHMNMLRQKLRVWKSISHAVMFSESGGARFRHSLLPPSIASWNILGALFPMPVIQRVALNSVSQA
jgi:hypothetical protein